MGEHVTNSRTSISTPDSVPLYHRWITLFRILVVCGALSALSHTEAFHFGAVLGDTRYGWRLFFLVYGGTAILGHALHSRGMRPAWLALGLGADIVAVTSLAYITGGPFSPLLFLYLPLVGLVAIAHSRAWGLGCAAVATGMHGWLADRLVDRALTLADGTVLSGEPPGGIVLQAIGLGSGMVLTAIATSFLTRRIAATSVMAATSSAIADEQRSLLRQIPDGVLKLRLDGTVEYCNEAAVALLSVPGCDLLNRSLAEHLHAIAPTEVVDLTPTESLRSSELTLPEVGGSPPRHLSCVVRPVFDHRHMLVGSFVFIRDVTTLRSAQEQLEIQERMARLLAASGEEEGLRRPLPRIKGFVGESAVMQRIFTLIERVAHFDATVLISGESGTGKELVAKSIHLGSPYGSGPFVAVNCGAIPENLIESELFGHKRGAFTGADSDAVGLFRRADGGTIFLDEIGELPLSLQAKLLRVLQERQIRPVGGDREVPIKVRVIAATNRNLRNEVKVGSFREDLFYRLNVVNIALPPLRERRDDIPPLVDSLLRQLSRGRAALPVVPPATLRILMSYDYPGNVRELENILERALVFGGEAILPEHLPEYLRADAPGNERRMSPQVETRLIVDETLSFPLDLDAILADTERRYLELALVRTNGAKKRAAELLGVNFRSFRYRLQKFNIASDLGDE